jgi:hypothetical protein
MARPGTSAGRANARAIREGRAHLPSSLTSGPRRSRESYINDVIAGRIERPPYGSAEGKSLARLASLASWGKANARYEGLFKDYWYHDRESLEE